MGHLVALFSILLSVLRIGMRINAPKAKVVPALNSDEQAILLDGEPLGEVDKFKHLNSMFITHGQGTKEFRSSINVTYYVSSRLQSWQRAGSTR